MAVFSSRVAADLRAAEKHQVMTIRQRSAVGTSAAIYFGSFSLFDKNMNPALYTFLMAAII